MRSADGLLLQDTMDDVFERWAWLYTFCRERLFTDHTELLAKLMEERFQSVAAPVFVELGCGPGFYSVSMAKRFPHWQVIGIDRSSRLLERAVEKQRSGSVSNCRFKLADVTCASEFPEQADLLLASRLLFILPDRVSALSAMHDGLRPGGRLLIAEPRPGWRSSVALHAMSALQAFGRRRRRRRSLAQHRALSEGELSGLVGRLHWQNVQRWSDDRYHYVLCERLKAEPRRQIA